MSNSLDDLKERWKAAGSVSDSPNVEVENLIRLSQRKMKQTINMHIGNITILAITLIGLALFFYFLAPLQETLSHVGITLMLGGLLLRIVIEIMSIAKSNKIDLSSSVEKTNHQYIAFYNYRKNIHGKITMSLLVAYTIGYYLLIPEFVDYFSKIMVIVLTISYIPVAMIFGFFIRKSIRDEMQYLDELMNERNKIVE